MTNTPNSPWLFVIDTADYAGNKRISKILGFRLIKNIITGTTTEEIV